MFFFLLYIKLIETFSKHLPTCKIKILKTLNKYKQRMKLANIILWCKNKFPNSFGNISYHLKQTKDPEEKACIYVAANTLVCFSIDMIYNIVNYAFSGVHLLLVSNLLSLTACATMALLYIGKKVTIAVALSALLFIVQTNTSMVIFHNYTVVIEQNRFIISHNLFLSFLICILASVSIQKNKVYILCILPLISLVVALIIDSPHNMTVNFPGFCLAFISPPVLLTYIRIFLWDTFRKKEQLFSERKSLCQLMRMDEKQWNLLIDVMQKPHAPRQQTEKLFDQIQEAIGSRLVIRAKRLLASEEIMERINEKYNFSLTANEVRLCCLILEDKSIKEISHILYINESSVRANRSRLRKKMEIDKKTNLKAHLLMLMSKEKNDCGDNFQEQDDDYSK